MGLSMDSRTLAVAALSPEAIEFVRFCYRRRRVGWPELYDEMCAVASRGLYLGWGFTELADHGIGFSLFETPTLARIAADVAREDVDRGGRSRDRAARAERSAEVSSTSVVERPEGPDEVGGTRGSQADVTLIGATLGAN
jgi:hypothetical protein